MKLSELCSKVLMTTSLVMAAVAFFLLLIGVMGFKVSALAGLLFVGMRLPPYRYPQTEDRRTNNRLVQTIVRIPNEHDLHSTLDEVTRATS